ncbi:MAG: hypothetical protein KGZ53_08460 [Peptococcaceae bacterium]|nr:hypothetical protein [Peptococcaceae bacterium]
MLLALLVMLLGLLNLRFDLLRNSPKRWVKGQIWYLAVGGPLCFLWVYLALPALIPWVGYTVVLLPLGANALVTLISRSIDAEKGNRAQSFGGLPLFILTASLLISFYLNVLVVPIRAQALRDVPVVRESMEPVPMMNIEHIRLVPIENALWKAQKVIGNMGSGFEVGNLTIQMVDGKLYWVAPLEFRGFFKWLSFKESPGFIIIDAEDPDAAAEFIAAPITYIPSAFFSKDLSRHVYNSYSDVLLLEASFEVDDDMKPWFVMSLGEPTVGKTGVVVTGAVVINPVNGEMEHYDLGSIPAWVDQVIPEYVAEKHNAWFGRYVHGFWNSIFSQRDVHVPTKWDGRIDVFGVIGPDDKFYWFTGHTSPSNKDDSLMGYTMTDGRTGEIVYYKNATGVFNESAAVASVNAAVSNFAGWHGAQPLLYNLYGSESYVVPVLSENYKLQAIGIVNARTGHTVVKPTKVEAMMAYRQYLGQGLGDVMPTYIGGLDTLEGTVTRVGSATMGGNTLFYFHISGSERIFTATSTISAEVALTNVGDRVAVSYLNTAEAVVPLAVFDNLELGSR